MKKMMTLAFAAIMSVAMSVNANAMRVENMTTEAAAQQCVGCGCTENLESRTMVHNENGVISKFVYIINASGAVISKTKYNFNAEAKDWTPVCIYRAYYGNEENKLVYSAWNAEEKAYTANTAIATYSKDECPVLMELPEVINY